LQDADEGFGFAVCPGGVGAGADVADAVLGEQAAEGARAVAGAVVGQDALDRGALLGIGGDHIGGEADAVGGAL
jgi:hypothetical protein